MTTSEVGIPRDWKGLYDRKCWTCSQMIVKIFIRTLHYIFYIIDILHSIFYWCFFLWPLRYFCAFLLIFYTFLVRFFTNSKGNSLSSGSVVLVFILILTKMLTAFKVIITTLWMIYGYFLYTCFFSCKIFFIVDLITETI